jgi:hypothetical protein
MPPSNADLQQALEEAERAAAEATTAAQAATAQAALTRADTANAWAVAADQCITSTRMRRKLKFILKLLPSSTSRICSLSSLNRPPCSIVDGAQSSSMLLPSMHLILLCLVMMASPRILTGTAWTAP